MARKLNFMIKSNDFLAIDLSSHDLKIAQINISPTRREISNLVTQSIQNLNDEDISKTIRQILNELGIVKPRVLLTIPSFVTITKNIEIPSRDPQEIKEIINLQASRHTPYSREEIIIDYVNIGTYRRNYSKVLLIIVPRSLIRRQLDILDKAGLSVERVTFVPEGVSYIVSKSLRFSALESPVGIIHLNDGFTDFLITQKDKVVFIRNVAIGAQHLLNDRERYESKFVEEIRKSLEVYTGEDIEMNPGRFVLTGAIDALQDLAGILSNSLHISTDNLSYINQLSISEKARRVGLSNRHLSFLDVISCLLAHDTIKVDLVPEEIKLEKDLKQRGREIIKAGILVMTAFVLIYCIMVSKIYIKSRYLRNLSVQYKSVHKEAQELEGNFIKNQIVRDFLSTRGFSLEILAELYEALPLDIQITYLRFDIKGNFSVEGTAESMAGVFSFVDSLGKSSYFKKVETRYTRKRKQGERDVADFALICSFNP